MTRAERESRNRTTRAYKRENAVEFFMGALASALQGKPKQAQRMLLGAHMEACDALGMPICVDDVRAKWPKESDG